MQSFRQHQAAPHATPSQASGNCVSALQHSCSQHTVCITCDTSSEACASGPLLLYMQHWLWGVQGVPLDVETVAAGMLSEAVASQHLSLAVVEARVGSQVANLIEHVLKVKRLPSRVDLYDDVTSRSACCSLFANMPALPRQHANTRSWKLARLTTHCHQLLRLLLHLEQLWRSAANAAQIAGSP